MLNFTDNMWRMQVFNSPTTAYTKEAKDYSFALGKYVWTIENDAYECNKDQGPLNKVLKLSGCSEGEFTCNDGQCVFKMNTYIYVKQYTENR